MGKMYTSICRGLEPADAVGKFATAGKGQLGRGFRRQLGSTSLSVKFLADFST